MSLFGKVTFGIEVFWAEACSTNNVWKKFLFNSSGYNKYGLLKEDIMHETPDVKEAIRRLPQDVQDLRIYRILRAVQANIQNSILPEEQWVKYEDDIPYLQPYLDEVLKEKKEKEDWEKAHCI